VGNLKSKIYGLSFLLFLGLWFYVYSYAQEEQKVPAAQEEQKPAEEQKEELDSLDASQNVTLDFKEADIRSVLKIIASKSGVNIVATPEVIGNVSIRLVEVPWEKALDVILKTNNFGYEWSSNKVIMVSTLEKLTQQRKAQIEVTENEPQATEVFVLNFSKAEDIKATLDKLITAKGKIVLENRSNTVVITDSKSNLAKIGEIIKRLDKMIPQVMIEAKIIETTLGNSEKLGIDWSTVIKATGSKRPWTVPFAGDMEGNARTFPKVQVPSELERLDTITYDTLGNAVHTQEEKVWNKLSSGFPAVSSGLFTFGTLDFTGFQAVLELLKSRSDTKIVSNPRITTLNNMVASIMVGKIVPIPTYGYSKETGNQIISGYADQNVGITLVVTPTINEQGYVTLKINPKVEDIIGSTGPNGERPVIATRSAETTVMIKDGRTLVIGGLISENKLKTKKGFPFLGSLPVLDLIFGNKQDTLSKTELLIFITPHIIKDDEFSPDEIAKIEKRLKGVTERPAKQEKNKK